ncbi:MAG: hypothetical protein ACE5EV_02995, partial [Gaiellales bacterium]
QTIVAFEGAAEVARITIDPAGEPQRFVVPLTSEDGRCTVRFAVTPTAVPDQVVGGGDPRELGVHMVGFFFSPGGAA